MTDEAQAAPAPTFDDNTMIPVQLADGKMGMEPLKNVRAVMAEASQLRAQAAASQAWKQDHDAMNQILGSLWARHGALAPDWAPAIKQSKIYCSVYFHDS